MITAVSVAAGCNWATFDLPPSADAGAGEPDAFGGFDDLPADLYGDPPDTSAEPDSGPPLERADHADEYRAVQAEVEPNDAPLYELMLFNASGRMAGEWSTEEDPDWIAVDLPYGARATVEAFGLDGSCTVDARIGIYTYDYREDTPWECQDLYVEAGDGWVFPMTCNLDPGEGHCPQLEYTNVVSDPERIFVLLVDPDRQAGRQYWIDVTIEFAEGEAAWPPQE